MLKTPKRTAVSTAGFTLMEVLISMVVIGLCTAAFLAFQTSSWSASQKARNTMAAGQLIEKQVEYLRMRIASSPKDTFPVLMAVGNQDSTVAKNITVRWVVANALDIKGAVMPNVRQVTFTAIWTAPSTDSIVVPTCISKNF
jgi:prepilin-type N-terminal cleavage/methylation domain-containing protein